MLEINNYLNSLIEITGVAEAFPKNPKSFKQIQVQEVFDIPAGRLGIEQLLHIRAEVKILNTSMISTSKGISLEGQMLTGLKLRVKGDICLKAEYVSSDASQAIYKTNFAKTFSTYIVLCEDFTWNSQVTVTPYIEDIYIHHIEGTRIYASVMVLLDAVPIMIFE